MNTELTDTSNIAGWLLFDGNCAAINLVFTYLPVVYELAACKGAAL